MWWMDFSKPRRTGEVLSGELTFKTRLWKLSKHCWVKSGRKRRRLFRKRLHKVKAFLHLKAQCVKRQTKLLIFIGGSDGKESACKAGDLGLIPGSGRSPEEGNYNPLQYSCLENSIDRETWQGPVHGVAKSQTPLSDYHFSVFIFFFLKALPNDGKSTLIIIFLPLWCWIIRMCVCAPLHPTLCNSMARLLCPWDFPGKNTGGGLPFPSPGDLPIVRFQKLLF